AERDYIEFVVGPAATGATATVHALSLPMDRPADYLLCGGNAHTGDGRVLFAGGSSPPDSGLHYSMLFDPAGGAWSRIRWDMKGGLRWYPTVTRLPDGRTLVTGGFF